MQDKTSYVSFVSKFWFACAVTKYMILCVYKSIPIMEDNFIATFLYLNINMVSFIIVGARMNLPGKYPINYVSS